MLPLTEDDSNLLITLHQLKRLALDVLFAANDIGKDWRQFSSLKLRCCYLQVEMSQIFVLEVKLDLIFV